MPKKKTTNKKLSPQARRNLDIEIGFLEGLRKRDPEYTDALKLLGDDYTRRGRFEDGLKIDQQLVTLIPNDPMVHYNLACSYSLTGQIDLGVSELDKALNLGYRDIRWMTQDPDLKPLRQHPLYEHIRTKLKSMKIDKSASEDEDELF